MPDVKSFAGLYLDGGVLAEVTAPPAALVTFVGSYYVVIGTDTDEAAAALKGLEGEQWNDGVLGPGDIGLDGEQTGEALASALLEKALEIGGPDSGEVYGVITTVAHAEFAQGAIDAAARANSVEAGQLCVVTIGEDGDYADVDAFFAALTAEEGGKEEPAGE